jgi:hypothetical protein
MGIRFIPVAISVLLVLMLGQAAKADSFQFSFQSIQGSGSPVSGSGTFEASLQCTQGGTYGASTITSLQGQLMMNGQSFDMGFTFNACLNFVDPNGQLANSIGHNTIYFTADTQQWDFVRPTVIAPFPFYLGDITTGDSWAITFNESAISTPEPSPLLFLSMGLLGLMGLTLLKNRLS